jgi:hypothetical protein
MKNYTHTVTAVFDSQGEFRRAVLRLEQAGVRPDQISTIVTEEGRNTFSIQEGTKASEGAITGAAIGGLTAALYAALAAASTVVLPGLNLVVSGVLASALVGFGAGAATGGLVGALVGFGVPEHEARLYEEKLRDGAALIAVHAASEQESAEVERVLKESAGHHVTALAA